MSTLHAACAWQLRGLAMPITFNDNLSVFPPKGDSPNDVNEIVRSPMDTRPLSLKNEDNKIIASVVNDLLKKCIATRAGRLQRGFVPGRQLIENVVGLDTAARLHGTRANSPSLPAFVFWDFAAAFPLRCPRVDLSTCFVKLAPLAAWSSTSTTCTG